MQKEKEKCVHALKQLTGSSENGGWSWRTAFSKRELSGRDDGGGSDRKARGLAGIIAAGAGGAGVVGVDVWFTEHFGNHIHRRTAIWMEMQSRSM